MTQHKVIAEDSLSAMDEISRVLGKDAVILKTEKINGKIHILGSNNIEDLATSNAKKINKNKSNFSHLFSNHNLEQKIQNRKVNNILNEKELNQNEHLENVVQTNIEDLNAKYVDVKTFSQFTTKIEKLLKNMVVSDIDELYRSNNKSLTIELLKKGFSKNIISEFQEQNLNKEDIDVELLFYHYLAKKLVLPYKDQIADSEIIFINGPSGSGKTTLVEKIISHVSASGVNVASIKHAHHLFDADHAGKDSFRHREAGARQVLVSSVHRSAHFLGYGGRGGTDPAQIFKKLFTNLLSKEFLSRLLFILFSIWAYFFGILITPGIWSIVPLITPL